MTLAQARILRSETAREETYSILDNDILPALTDLLEEYGNDLHAPWRNLLVAMQSKLEDLAAQLEFPTDDEEAESMY